MANYDLISLQAALNQINRGSSRDLAQVLRALLIEEMTLRASLTFAVMPRVPTQTVAATGTNQATAAALIAGHNLVTAADATKGVVLPTAVAGEQVSLRNGANAILEVYPATGDTIDGGTVNVAISVPAYGAVSLVAFDDTDWNVVGSDLAADVPAT